ncbi:hypothetical protein Hanom_Chr07g00581841 [Helianthus anomalus]
MITLASRALTHLSDTEASSSRVFSSSEVVLKIARAELELWVLLASRARAHISRLEPSRARARASKNMTSRARAQSSSGSARLVYTSSSNICIYVCIYHQRFRFHNHITKHNKKTIRSSP